MFYCTSFLFIPAHKCLFSISFHPHTPLPFPSHFPSLPVFPPSQGRALCGLAGLVSFGSPRTPKHAVAGQPHTQTPTSSVLKARFLCSASSELSRKDKRVTVGGVCGEGGGVGNRKKKRGSELLGCAFLWLAWLRSAKKTCCWLFSLLSPSHMGWQALGVWWDTFVCVHMHAIVCQGELDGVIMRTLQLL